MSTKIDRREFFLLAGSGMVSMGNFSQGGLPPEAPKTSSPEMLRILALFSYRRGIYYFNPAGLYVEVGQTVEWVGLRRRTVTAFHPSLDNRELRIPESAEPFDSKTMGSNDGVFRWTFEVEGTYDYYSQPQEYLGMVGRIVVGRPGGPGEKPPGYGNREGRTVMYPDAARLLEYLKSDEIVQKKVIPCPLEVLERKFPWR
jgi:plastocyanin